MKKKIYFLALLFPLLSGCDDFFAPNTDDTLLEKDYIGTSYELYTGYMGLAACVQDVVDQAMFLEGLRGDLLEPTTNAPVEMWDVIITRICNSRSLIMHWLILKGFMP